MNKNYISFLGRELVYLPNVGCYMTLHREHTGYYMKRNKWIFIPDIIRLLNYARHVEMIRKYTKNRTIKEINMHLLGIGRWGIVNTHYHALRTTKLDNVIWKIRPLTFNFTENLLYVFI